MKLAFYLIAVLIPGITIGQQQILKSEFIHLRDGRQREWSSFPPEAKDSLLKIRFQAKKEPGESTLALTQSDINHTWKVILNDKLLGMLVIDEKQMVTYFTVPPGILKENDNILIIRSESSGSIQADDIYVGHLILYNSAIEQLLTESSLNIHVGLPSRLTILNDHNSLQPVRAFPGDTLAVRSGVIYSGTGNFSFSLPAGKYKIYASRGFEYGVDSALINIKPEQKLVENLRVPHEVNLKDWVSCDPHVHTLEYSGHGDALMKERILTIAGEGLDYAVVTEHNKMVNIDTIVKNMDMDKWFTPITGNEFTTKVGHFNVFPCGDETVPSADVNNWNEVIQSLNRSPDKKIIILNHARDVHNGFRPSDSFPDITSGKLPANAMEVMNSGSQQTDSRQLYLDWMGLMKKGIILTPVGSSDSHDVSRFIVGQARTYVRSDSDLVTNFLKGKVGVSFGLFTELEIDTASQQKNDIIIRVHSPSWIKADKVMLFANGEKIFTSMLAEGDKSGNTWILKFRLPEQPRGATILAIAEGADPQVPWWPVAKPYQHASPEVNPIVLGISEVYKIR